MSEPRVIAFELPYVLPSLNAMLRAHWSQRGRAKATIARDVMVALGGPAHFPRPSWSRVRVHVTRRGRKLLDADNLAASVKPLIDSLCQRSATHPTGLGIITDDAPHMLTLTVVQALCGRAQPSTAVRIECMDEER